MVELDGHIAVEHLGALLEVEVEAIRHIRDLLVTAHGLVAGQVVAGCHRHAGPFLVGLEAVPEQPLDRLGESLVQRARGEPDLGTSFGVCGEIRDPGGDP